MPLKSRNVFPPGGWQFFQAETSWKMPGGKTFSEAVQAMIAHRKANPRFNFSLEPDAVGALLDTFTCYRIGFDVNYCDPEPEAQKKTSNPKVSQSADPSPSAPQESKPSFLARLAGLSNGAQILAEWLGAGGEPVDIELADHRGSVCRACPKNKPVTGFDKITEKVAATIRARNLAGIKVVDEEFLGICEACRCHLGLKVHVPMEHIQNNTKTYTAFHPDCWILKEFNAGNSTKAQSGAS